MRRGENNTGGEEGEKGIEMRTGGEERRGESKRGGGGGGEGEGMRKEKNERG